MMQTLATEITIEASAQTVWSILDDLAFYPEWNALIPELAGRTIVGETLVGRLVQPNTPVIPLAPTLTRIVGARELRWKTVIPGDAGFSAEHYFILTPTAGSATHLVHNEDFDGPAIAFMWPGIDSNGRAAYNQMNIDLKNRAEALERAEIALHPAVDGGPFRKPSFDSGARHILRCLCTHDPVEVTASGQIFHNHLCGCSLCWKPANALFAQTAVVSHELLAVTAHAEKLAVVDPLQSIQRSACTACGVHMLGRVADRNHHFFGLAFIHPELSDAGSPKPEFAGFVSSVIESGATPSQMRAVRRQLMTLDITPYDSFSPELMDLIAWHQVKLRDGRNA